VIRHALFLLRLLRTCAFALGALLFAAQSAFAQDTDETPARVGRVANVLGTLYHVPPEQRDAWTPIGLNAPVAQGDDLWTGDDTRAEVDYGGGQFRLWSRTNVHVSRLDERALALFVASGNLILRVRYLEPGDSVRIDTASTQVALARPGLYRIDVDADPPQTTLIVREGEADVATAVGVDAVYPGQFAVLAGTGDVHADIANGGGLDAFDTWGAARDRVYEGRPYQYVSPEMVGSYDLGEYGTWQSYPDYGPVWFPTVDPEWAPYRFGHWTWVPDFGYAWVDSAPWGYAPFHYGRWAYIGGHWGWCPGTYVRRPAWAPALVAWYGGSGWTYRAANDAPLFGWVPLGWGEAYVPGWRACSSRCYVRYNRPYHVDVSRRVPAPPSRLVNWSVPGGTTTVPATTVATGRPVAINHVPISVASAKPPALAAPPAIAPIVTRPGTVRPGGIVPPPASALAAPPGASLPASAPAAPPRANAATPPPSTAPIVPRIVAPAGQVPITRIPAPRAPSAGERAAPLRPIPTPQSPEPTLPLRPAVPPPAAPAPLRVPNIPAPVTPLPVPSIPQPMPAPVAPPRVVPLPSAPAPSVVPAPAPRGPVPAAPAPAPSVPAPSGVPLAPPPVRSGS
jgi:hypothetical protein